jgi:hypothetical protein
MKTISNQKNREKTDETCPVALNRMLSLYNKSYIKWHWKKGYYYMGFCIQGVQK